MGAGIDPTSGLGAGLGSLDPSSIFGGLGGLGGFDPLSGLGTGIGAIGGSTSSPGGDISQVASAEGDPTGALQAQQSIQAGAPTPGTPGGGIGGAQSGVPSTQPAAAPPSTGNLSSQAFDQRYAGTNQAQQAAEQTPPDQQSTQGKTQYGPPMQPPANFSQRYGDASFAQRFGQNNMAPGGNMASTLPQLSQAQIAQAGTNFPEAQPGLAGLTGGGAGAPNVDSPTAGPATPTTTGGAPAAAPATADTTGADTGAKTAATGAGTAKTAEPTDASSTGERDPTTGQPTGRGGPGGGMPNINPLALISALLRGGPMGALSELAREAQGQGMMQPSLPGGGAPGRRYSGGGTGQPGEEEAPETPAPGATTQTPEQAQAAQAAAAGQEAPGIAPTSTGFEPGQPGQPASTEPRPTPPAWAQAAAGQIVGQPPNTTATQNAALGGGNIPSTGNAQVDRWVSPQHVSMNRNAGTNTPGTPGYSSTMRDARAPYFNQLTPQDRTLLYGMMHAENERDPIGPMESIANRAAANHMSIGHLVRSGFYGPRASFLRRGLAIQNSGRAGHYDSVINAVQRGSNVLGGATDQGSGRDPNVGWRGGRIMRSGEVYNDWGGGRGHNANRSWREQIQARVRQENAANPPRPPMPIPNAQRAGEGSPIAAFGPGSMGRGGLEPAGGWSRRSFEDVNNPTFGERFAGDTPREEARIRKANYEAGLPGYTAPPSQLANALGLGDIRLDQITQLLSQLQASPPQ